MSLDHSPRPRLIGYKGFYSKQFLHFMKQNRKNSQDAKRLRMRAKPNVPKVIFPEAEALSPAVTLVAGAAVLVEASSAPLSALAARPANAETAEPVDADVMVAAPITVEGAMVPQTVPREVIVVTNRDDPPPFPAEATVAIEPMVAAGGGAPVLVESNPVLGAATSGASPATVEPKVVSERELLSPVLATAKLATAPQGAAYHATEVINLEVDASDRPHGGLDTLSTELPVAVGLADQALPAVARSAKRAQGEEIIRDYRALAMGAGLIPVPGADMVAIVGLQLKVLASLAELYEVAFTLAQARLIVTSLLAAVGSTILARSMFFSLAKAIPCIGPILGAASLPLAGGAITHAIGHLAIDHFEAGGTLESFNLDVGRRSFGQKVAEAKAKLA